MNNITRWVIWVTVLTAVLVAVSVVSLGIGPVRIPLGDVLSALTSGEETTEYDIVFKVRLPRILLGFAVGGALSLAGVLLQGMFRNPLVEPYTLGISGGAALGVSLNIVLGLAATVGVMSLPASGFLGAIGVVLLVYFLGTRRGVLRMRNLLLTGVMISFICSSLVMLIMAVCRAEDLHGIIFWIMGSLEEPSWFLIKLALGVSIVSLVVSYFFAVDLNAMSAGEEEAMHLGVNVERTKRLLFILASLMTGLSVSVAGVIGFVGLVVPHFLRMFVGGDHRILLVTSFLSGGIFLIFCDTLARTIISPIELPVGVITGILGGIIFVYALSRGRTVLGGK